MLERGSRILRLDECSGFFAVKIANGQKRHLTGLEALRPKLVTALVELKK